MEIRKALTLFALALNGLLFSQDFHFTQFYTMPLHLNPGSTGDFDGDWRVAVNARRQWSQISNPFNSNAVSYDRQFYLGQQRFSAGATILNDISGDGRLTTSKYLLSGSYHYKILDYNLHGGIQTGLIQLVLDNESLLFPDQYNHNIGEFDEGTATAEALARSSAMLFDLNAGISASKYITSKLLLEAGYSVMHLNGPKKTFSSIDYRLPIKSTVFAKGSYQLTSTIGVHPMYMVTLMGKAQEMLIGANASYKLPENPLNLAMVFGGVMHRNGFGRVADSHSAIGGFKIGNYVFGVSYDHNYSDLHVATKYRGAIEFSLIYTSINTVPTQTIVPCVRF